MYVTIIVDNSVHGVLNSSIHISEVILACMLYKFTCKNKLFYNYTCTYLIVKSDVVDAPVRTKK